MQEKQVFTSYLTTKIAEFNFDQFYTRKNRILLHITMWLCFSMLLFQSYVLAYHLTYFNALILTLRMTTVNMIVFYIFFYLFVPKIFLGSGGRIVLLLMITFPLCVFVWIAITYFFR